MDFCVRMAGQYDRLIVRDVNFRLPPPTGFEGPRAISGDTSIAPLNIVPGGVARYTIDGSEPTAASSPVVGAIPVHDKTTLRARTFLADGRNSPVATGYFSRVDSNVHGVEWAVFAGALQGENRRDIQAPLVSGHRPGVGLEGLPLAGENISVRFEGRLVVEKEGVYAFTLNSNGRAFLNIGSFPVASDTTSAWGVPAVGYVKLRAGDHPFSLMYKKNPRGAGLDLQVEGPELEKQRIPAGMLRRK